MASLELTSALTRRQCGGTSTSGRPITCHPRPFLYAISHHAAPKTLFQTITAHKKAFITHAADEIAESMDTSDISDGDWVEVGVIGPPHGVRGEFKCQPLTDFPEDRLGEPGPRWLLAPAPKIGKPSSLPEPEAVELEWGRTTIFKGREIWIVKLEEINSPEEAALIKGQTLLIPAAAREPLDDEDEFYVQELVGLRVFMNKSGEEVGKVVDLFDGTGTHDVLRIELSHEFVATLGTEGGKKENKGDSGVTSSGPRQVMLPFVKALVPIVDIKSSVMRIEPPDGLFELAVEVQKKQIRKENAGKKEKRRPRTNNNNNNKDIPPSTAAASSGRENSIANIDWE